MHTFILLLVSIVGATLTFYINEHMKQGPVRSSALLSLVVASLCHLCVGLLPVYLAKNIPIVFIGSSFIGMVSKKVLSNYAMIGFAGLIFCLVYLNASRFFNGYGGALGTSAAISLLAVLSLPIVRKHGKFTNGFNQLRKIMFGKEKKDEKQEEL
ncbi:hypothetical protein LX64_01381 [Chitinophaga skermanii]|uniref:Uncharacterized protein n=1 Tax=Chitinophaga skermanii TaxID=331697 RepID=A0A327R4B8_9BACT|nr:hypothetical protein [Chitinophaga skermanii]RAJ08727.1 hypothetical protein LX64_01381 [Chitinophaga skermanii]